MSKNDAEDALMEFGAKVIKANPASLKAVAEQALQAGLTAEAAADSISDGAYWEALAQIHDATSASPPAQSAAPPPANGQDTPRAARAARKKATKA